MRLLIFTVDRIQLALPAHAVVELHRAVLISPLPNAPEGVLGSVNVRGTVLPVFDLRIRCGMPPRRERTSDLLIRARTSSAEVLLLADTATELAEAGPALPTFTASAPGVRVGAKYANVNGILSHIIDLEAFLDAPARDLLAAALSRVSAGEEAHAQA